MYCCKSLLNANLLTECPSGIFKAMTSLAINCIIEERTKATVQTEQRPATDARRERAFVAPEVNIFETSDGYVLEAEMPGVSKEGLGITLEGNEITIVGHRRNELAPGNPLFRGAFLNQ